MRILLTILIFLLFSGKTFATPQVQEVLIYGEDTMYVDFYPLEMLMDKDEVLYKMIMRASDCLLSCCWRGHVGTWKIKNDSLFLVRLQDGCLKKDLKLSLFFDTSEISKNGVFAYWFSQEVVANYGKWLDYNEINWSSVYEGTFKCNLNKGIISNVKIEMKEPIEIENIKQKRIKKVDTMVCIIVDEYPILIAGDKEYKTEELEDFILKHIRYPANGTDSMGSVYISLVVEKDGTATNKAFSGKLCKGYDKEALKVINMMTKWKQGLINGNPVRTKIFLPLRFRN